MSTDFGGRNQSTDLELLACDYFLDSCEKMALFAQAFLAGQTFVIECGTEMTCCQREQAQQKVNAYRQEISGADEPAGPLQVAPAGASEEIRLSSLQRTAWNRLERDMDNAKNKEERTQVAKQHGASDCLAEQLAEDWKKGGPNTATTHGVQMDHPVDIKFGGAVDPAGFVPLDSEVNNFFGQMVGHGGRRLDKGGITEVTNVILLCTPPCKPPKKKDRDKDYSAGASEAPPTSPADRVVQSMR
ncbi:MAG: hypothetical protein HY348_10110 [Nitrospira defluvii]|nr:hypothetical protein [Nitrospira defluvii]